MRILAVLVALTLAATTPLKAQQLLESYVAFLSVDDHYNSRGARLTAPWQVIRQDRANFHRFGIRDAGDEWDSFFSSQQNRAIAERMLRNGYIEPGFASYIVNNEALVRVEIFGRGNRGDFIRVSAY